MSKYKAIITTAGAAKIAAAAAAKAPLKITRMAVGDGGGKLPEPNPAQTKLVNEKYRAALNGLTLDKALNNHIIAELIIPPAVGGFWLREMGLYDDTGTLIAVSNMAESYKPRLEEGSGRTQTLRMVLIVSSTAAIELIVSGDTVLATKEYVTDAIHAHEKTRNHPDASTTAKGLVQLSSATTSNDEGKAATPRAVKSAIDASMQKSANLSDLTDKARARVNLALGSAATRNVGTAKGQVMEVGAFGIGGAAEPFGETTNGALMEAARKRGSGIARNNVAGPSVPMHGTGFYGHAGDTHTLMIAEYGSGRTVVLSANDANIKTPAVNVLYGTANPPRAADVQAADVRNNFAAKMGVNRTLLKDSQPTSAGVWSVEGNTWTPEAWGTLLCTNNRPDLKADKGNGQFHHYLFLSHSRKLWVATNVNGNWSGWQAMYSTTNKPTAADVGALPLTGGNLTGPVSSTSWLSATALTATYHTTTAGKAPEGSGAFAAQLDSKAPFYQANFDWDVTSGGHYVPLVKGRSNRKGQGYPTAVSFGYLLDGTPDFAHPCIHVKADNAEALWRFNTANGNITSKAGTVATQEWVNTHCPFPVGYVMLMGSGSDPNGLYPGTQWQNLNATGYDGRVISLGYDAMGTGGNNKVTLGAHNLPDHSHRGGMNAPGAGWGDMETGTDNSGRYKLGNTTHTFTNGNGNEVVRNEPVDVTNAYVHVRGWMRTA